MIKSQSDPLLIINSLTIRCEKTQIKFKEGSAQHSLLVNRIRALYVAKSLLIGDSSVICKEDCIKAREPIASIISKCKKASGNNEPGSAAYKRTDKLINVMNIALSLIDEILMNEGFKGTNHE